MILLLVFLYIKFSILHLCVSDSGYFCGPDTMSHRIIITLSQLKGSEINQKLNEKFIEKCKIYYTINITEVENNDYLTTLKRKYSHFIDLYVTDYYKYNAVVKPMPTFIFAGETTTGIKSNSSVIRKNSNLDSGQTVKLITTSLLTINDWDLYDFVQKIEYINGTIRSREKCLSVIKDAKLLQTVLLCLDAKAGNKDVGIELNPPLKLQITTTASCRDTLEDYNNNFLAVLAPKPFEIDYELSLPTIFYETPYLFPEIKITFTKSTSLLPWKLLKYGFLNFIKNVGWSRLVIVTDDSPYSIAFENELTTLFNKELITYKVIRCEDAKCDMEKIIDTLNSIGVKIAIANVEERNARFLINYSRKRIWLVRDMTSVHQENVFSFTLGPIINNYHNCKINKNLINGVRTIALAYKDLISEDFLLSKKQFYRKFAMLINRTKNPEAIAFTYRKSQEIASVHVNKDGADEISFKNPYKNNKPPDSPKCLVRSFKYDKPCEDDLVVLFMFVGILFLTMILIITCYFHKTSPFHDIRYQNLY